MKWLPEPSEPSCTRQLRATPSACSTPSIASSEATCGCADSSTEELCRPADSGMTAAMAACSA